MQTRRPRSARPLAFLLGVLIGAGGCAPALAGAEGAAEREPGSGRAPRAPSAPRAAAAEQEDYVSRYAKQGPPSTADVAEYADNTSFPPRLKAEPSDEQFDVQRTRLDLDDSTLDAARTAALDHPEVREALGERFVEIAIGADVPVKAGDGSDTEAVVGVELFSYTRGGAVRAAVAEGKVVSVTRLDPEYSPRETAVEIARAVELVTADEHRAELVRGAEAEGLLTPCEKSVRCLYLQFVRDGGIVYSATVDLVNETVFDELENPDETPES